VTNKPGETVDFASWEVQGRGHKGHKSLSGVQIPEAGDFVRQKQNHFMVKLTTGLTHHIYKYSIA